MKRLVLILTVMISACASTGIKQPDVVKVPVLFCPAPSEYHRPDMPIEQMTDNQKQSPGEVAKRYKATIKALQGYISELETQLDNYKKIHDSYDKTTSAIPGDEKQ